MTALKVREGADTQQAPMQQDLLLPGEPQRLEAIEASSRFILPVGTQWVERDVLGIANEVATRWPNLQIASCTCGRCLAEGHYPHAVMEHCRDGVTRPVFGFTKLNRTVIDRLKAIHESQNPEAKHHELNEKRRREDKQAADDAQREQLEVVEAALRSPKHRWKGPNGMQTDPNAKLATPAVRR